MSSFPKELKVLEGVLRLALINCKLHMSNCIKSVKTKINAARIGQKRILNMRLARAYFSTIRKPYFMIKYRSPPATYNLPYSII